MEGVCPEMYMLLTTLVVSNKSTMYDITLDTKRTRATFANLKNLLTLVMIRSGYLPLSSSSIFTSIILNPKYRYATVVKLYCANQRKPNQKSCRISSHSPAKIVGPRKETELSESSMMKMKMTHLVHRLTSRRYRRTSWHQ